MIFSSDKGLGGVGIYFTPPLFEKHDAPMTHPPKKVRHALKV